MNMPSCCGSCRQGRERCPTPEACLLPVDPPAPGGDKLFALLVGLVVLFTGAFVVGAAWTVWPVLLASLN